MKEIKFNIQSLIILIIKILFLGFLFYFVCLIPLFHLLEYGYHACGNFEIKSCPINDDLVCAWMIVGTLVNHSLCVLFVFFLMTNKSSPLNKEITIKIPTLSKQKTSKDKLALMGKELMECNGDKEKEELVLDKYEKIINQ